MRRLAALLLISSACRPAAGAPPDGGTSSSGTGSAGTSGSGGTSGGTGTPADGGPCGNLPPATVIPHAGAQLALEGDPGAPPDGGVFLGVYDPSLVYPPDAGGGVLSYSSVSPNDVHTRIAVSTDRGATFTFVTEANQTNAATIQTSDATVCGSTSCSAVLWHEVSSIVPDPGDPDPTRAYKLFTHTYASLQGGSMLRRDWGYISLYTAPAPNGHWTETPLLGWKSSATISTSGVTQVLTDLPQLSDCIAFTEPGALVTPQGLDLALACFSAPPPGSSRPSARIVLLRSTDHAASFQYVGELLGPSDADCLGSSVSTVNGADLFFQGGSEYLSVTPVAPITPSGVNYAGCAIIPLADAGAVARTGNGAPQVVRWITSDDGRFTGPCTYAEGATAAGYLVPMLSQPTPPLFHILPTGIAAP